MRRQDLLLHSDLDILHSFGHTRHTVKTMHVGWEWVMWCAWLLLLLLLLPLVNFLSLHTCWWSCGGAAGGINRIYSGFQTLPFLRHELFVCSGPGWDTASYLQPASCWRGSAVWSVIEPNGLGEDGGGFFFFSLSRLAWWIIGRVLNSHVRRGLIESSGQIDGLIEYWGYETEHWMRWL